MNSRTYYGEYTLSHWIKLMMTGNIVLPEYQRRFVWQKRDIQRFIQSLKEGQFVQPVTIALFNNGTEKKNLILDGQQRLTSLLLAYIGYYPDRKKFEEGLVYTIATEDDSASDDDYNDQTIENNELPNKGIKWRFPELLKHGTSKAQIVNYVSRDTTRYSVLDTPVFSDLNEEFFNNTYLGFSYIVPESTNAKDIQTSFSKLFRNINYFGMKLDAMESRKSLYYQNAYFTNYFDGKCDDHSDVLCDLNILENWKPCEIDFVRYLAILSQFKGSHREDARDIMVGYSSYGYRESYYADYVAYLLGIEQEDRINKFNNFKFTECFPSDDWKERFVTLRNTIMKLKPQMQLKDDRSFVAWYEADYWLFGLIYCILFDGKQLNDDLSRTNQNGVEITLFEEIRQKIDGYKDSQYVLKNSNRLGYVRERLVESYNIFCHYVQD